MGTETLRDALEGEAADEIVGVHRKAERTAEAARLSRIIVRRTRWMTRDEFN